LIVYLVFYLFAFILYKKKIFTLISLSIIAHLVLVFFIFEVGLGNVDYYISDGFQYINNPEDWITDIDRATWGYINYFEKYYDVFGVYFAKFINIPLILIFNKLLQNLFQRNLWNINIILFLPYYFYLGISNLRDVLIMIVLLLVISNFNKKEQKHKILTFVFLLTLYTLRPFIAVITLIVLSYYWSKRRMNKNYLSKAFYLSLAFGFIFLCYLVFQSRISQYTYNLQYYLSEGLSDRVIGRDAEQLGDPTSPLFWVKAHLRYIFTPMPHSLAINLLEHSSDLKYGLTSRVLRIINQLIYFGFIIYIFINFKKILKVLRTLSIPMKSFLLVCFTYMPIYSIFHFGGVHQRTKLPFQVCIIIIGCLIYKFNKTKKIGNKKSSNFN